MKDQLTPETCPRTLLPKSLDGFQVVGVVNKISENACDYGSASFELQTTSDEVGPPKVLRLRTYPGNADAFINNIQVGDLVVVNFNITSWLAQDKCRERSYLNAYSIYKGKWK